jgi:hypothetical protein
MPYEMKFDDLDLREEPATGKGSEDLLTGGPSLRCTTTRICTEICTDSCCTTC